MLKEFKDFAMRGNVLDMAIGVIIGGAFDTVGGLPRTNSPMGPRTARRRT